MKIPKNSRRIIQNFLRFYFLLFSQLISLGRGRWAIEKALKKYGDAIEL